MGANLSLPAKIQHSVHHPQFEGVFMEMLGGRDTMEDEHLLYVSETEALFGIFDGHGGKRASQWISENIASKLVPLFHSAEYQACTTLEARTALIQQCFGELDRELFSVLKTAESKRRPSKYYNGFGEETNGDDDDNNFHCGTTAVLAYLQISNTLSSSDCSWSAWQNRTSNTKSVQRSIKCTAINLGDSHLMILDAVTGEIRYQTEDHKPELPREAQRVLSSGGQIINGYVAKAGLSPSSPNTSGGTRDTSSVGGVKPSPTGPRLAMTRAFGDFHLKDYDLSFSTSGNCNRVSDNSFNNSSNNCITTSSAQEQLQPQQGNHLVLAEPEVAEWILNPTDLLFLSSDGIFEIRSNYRDCAQYLYKEAVLCEKSLHQVMLNLLDEYAKDSQDNLSALLIQFRNNPVTAAEEEEEAAEAATTTSIIQPKVSPSLFIHVDPNIPGNSALLERRDVQKKYLEFIRRLNLDKDRKEAVNQFIKILKLLSTTSAAPNQPAVSK
jgi:serine/threonine protein phosphatase PrpC